jgi:hypothetical protein
MKINYDWVSSNNEWFVAVLDEDGKALINSYSKKFPFYINKFDLYEEEDLRIALRMAFPDWKE